MGIDIEFRVAKLNQIGWYFDGEAVINFWGGGQGSVYMTPWTLLDKFSEEEMMKGINDGQFGCESIESADVSIYRLYENRYKEFEETYYYTKKQLEESKY